MGGKKMNILFFGDSNTYGSNPKDHTRFDRNTRFTGILAQMFPNDYLIEEGYCGRTTVFHDPYDANRRGASYLPVCLKSHSPLDLVFIMLGTNDCKDVYNVSAYAIAKGIETLIGQVKAVDENVKIVIIAPVAILEEVAQVETSSFSTEAVKKSQDLARHYETIAKAHHCGFLDLNHACQASLADGVHLDAKTHGIIARQLANVIKYYAKES